MTLSDPMYESARLARLRRMGWKFGNVAPEDDEYCDSPGRGGCGVCPGCENWADEELERKRDEEWGLAILKDCEERGRK